MKTIIGIIASLTAALSLASCSAELVGGDRSEPFEVSFSLAEEEMEQTKGLISSSVGENEIRCWAVAAYDGDGNLYSQNSGNDGSCAHLSLPSGTTYELYFLVNCPDVVFPETVSQVTGLEVRVQSVEQMARDGLPSCAKITGYVPTTTSRPVYLKRLVCCLKLKVSQSGLSTMELKNVRFCNAPAGVYPFGSACYNETLETFDYSSGQLESLGFGDEITLYCFENLRGTISNSDPKKKIPEYMSEEQAQYATYLDVEADVTGRVNGKVHYRIYPGANTTSDFNLKRSYVYRCDLSLSQAELLRGCVSPYWKIDVTGVDAVRVMGRRWAYHDGYFWPYMGWDEDRLVVDNPFGRLQYTIITAEDSGMDEGIRSFGPYSPGAEITLTSGGSSFHFDFAESYIDVDLRSEDPERWWWIRVVNLDDNSVVMSPIYQDGQSPLSLDFQSGRTLSDIYVGQSCSVHAIGPILDWSQLEWVIIGESGIVELENDGGRSSNRIRCLKPGTVRIMARCGDVISDVSTLNVKTPKLTVPGTLSLYEDGKDVPLLPRYYRTNGRPLYQEEFDKELFDSLLRPLSFSWSSGSCPSYVDSVYSRAETASYGNSYSDWSFHLTDVREPGAIDRVTVTNPAGCSAVFDVVCRLPFQTNLPKELGTLENYYYLQGNRKTDPIPVPYMILSTSAGDLENVTITDGSGLFDYKFVTYGDGYRLETIDMKSSAFRTNPDFCGDVDVRMSVRNRYSGRTYVSTAVYRFSVRLHLAVTMRLYSELWPTGKYKTWYLTPCWYMPEGCTVNPYWQVSSLIITWHRHNSNTYATSYDCLELKSFYEYQIGNYAENMYRKRGMFSLNAYTEGDLFFSTYDDFDLQMWWVSDPSNKNYYNKYKSFKGGTLSLMDCPGVGKNILVHDFTASLEY